MEVRVPALRPRPRGEHGNTQGSDPLPACPLPGQLSLWDPLLQLLVPVRRLFPEIHGPEAGPVRLPRWGPGTEGSCVPLASGGGASRPE